MMVEPQRLEPFARHFRADRIVMMEADLAAGLEPACFRLADVMGQRGQAKRQVGSGHGAFRPGLQRYGAIEHNHRVLEHVLVAVVLVDFQLQGGNLREYDIGET